MLAIRMQRVGRSGHAQFRMIVQDSHFHPTSGRVVAYLGSYNPHTKAVNVDKDKLATYLANGAQPSERVVKLLKQEKVKLPEWVAEPAKKTKAVRNADKRRSTRPEGAPEPEAAAPAEEAPATEELAADAEAPSEKPESAEAPAEPAAEEAPAEAVQEAAEAEKPESETTDEKPA